LRSSWEVIGKKEEVGKLIVNKNERMISNGEESGSREEKENL
jgi:hypothetical protein